jgi:acyl carrier protein
MVPSAVVFLEEMPLTPNGKVDRKALPEPEWSGGEASSGFVAPRTPVEEVLSGIWEQVLSVERVGVHDNFFELGGHSLLAVQFISRLREIFQVELGARDLFDAPTVAGLAAIIAERRPRARLEEEHLADTLALVEELSAEEIEKLLSEQD